MAQNATLTQLETSRLVVSCQPVVGGPLDCDETVVALAQAAVVGGAAAVRIEGAARIRAVRARVQVPIIGIIKRPELPVYITPTPEDINAVAKAGADIVAFDATQRSREVSATELLSHIHHIGLVAMADCADIADADVMHQAGCEIIGTTLSGYLDGPDKVPATADFTLIRDLATRNMRVMAEGRIHTPEDAKQALACGAWAVTVGTALTRLEVTTSWFCQALANH